jgi:hypothetical protein
LEEEGDGVLAGLDDDKPGMNLSTEVEVGEEVETSGPFEEAAGLDDAGCVAASGLLSLDDGDGLLV